MVAAALDRPGLRLSQTELLAGRNVLSSTLHHPVTRRSGALVGKQPGAGMDLREIRTFSEGDDPRRIDPAASARTGTLHVRSFNEDRDDATLLIADFRPLMLWGTDAALRSVRAARLLARLGWQALERGGSLGLAVVANGTSFMLAPATGEAQMIAITAAMVRGHDAALETPGSDAHADLSEILARSVKMAPLGASVHLATGMDGLALSADPMLARLARGRRLSVHIILDRVETAPPSQALPVADAVSFRHGRLGEIDCTPCLQRLRALGAEAVMVMPDDG